MKVLTSAPAGDETARDREVAVGIGIAVNTMPGPQCAMLPELFGDRHRHLGVIAAITTGATFVVPETRGSDLLLVEDAVRISTTEGAVR